MIEPMDYEQGVQYADRVRTCARDGMQRDTRFRRLVDSTAAFAMEEYGPIDPDDAREAAANIARNAAAILLARIYAEDAEILALKLERDHYRKIAEDALDCVPPRLHYGSAT